MHDKGYAAALTLALALVLGQLVATCALHPAMGDEEALLTVTFDGDADAAGSMEPAIVEANATWCAPEPTFTKAGSRAVAWAAVSSDGMSVELAPGSEVTGLITDTGVDLSPFVSDATLALTLVWEDVEGDAADVEEAAAENASQAETSVEAGSDGVARVQPDAASEGTASEDVTADHPATEIIEDDAEQDEAAATTGTPEGAAEAAVLALSALSEETLTMMAGLTEAAPMALATSSETDGQSPTKEGTAYAILTDEGDETYGAGTLVLFRSTGTIATGEGRTVTDVCGHTWSGRVWSGIESAYTADRAPWSQVAQDITRVVVAPGQLVRPRKCIRWFQGATALVSCDLTGLSLDRAANGGCASMFYGCSSLAELDLSFLETAGSGVTSVASMLCGCASLAELDLTPLDGLSVTATGLLEGCASLGRITLGSFPIEGVGLADAPDASPHGGLWVREGDHAHGLTAVALASAHDADPETYAGAWVWQVAWWPLALDLAGGASPEGSDFPDLHDARETLALPGTAGSELAAPVRPGFAFTGWVDEAGHAVTQVPYGLFAPFFATATWEPAQIRVRLSVSCTLEASTKGEGTLSLACTTAPEVTNLSDVAVSCSASLEGEALSSLSCAPTVEGEEIQTATTTLTSHPATLERALPQGSTLSLSGLAGEMESTDLAQRSAIGRIAWTFEAAS